MSADFEGSAELAEVFGELWRAIDDAVRHPRNPLRTPVFTTAADDGPQARTVVLRAVDQKARRLTLHTDIRSGKVREIETAPRVAWLFWDARRRLQFRAVGVASVASGDDPGVAAAWERVPLGSRVTYCTADAPGTTLQSAASGLPGDGSGRDLDLATTDRLGRDNFAVVDTTVERLDWLHLRRGGHRRARFDWDGRWRGCWVVP